MSRNISEPERSVAHAITDLDGRFLSVDDSFCELLLRERHEVLGQTILDLTAGEYRPINAEKLDRLRKVGTSFVIRKAYLRGDGGMQPVENMVSLLRNGAGPSVLAATVTSQEAAPDAGLVAGLAVARLLLRERRARVPSGLIWCDDDLALLLAAYVLETEGSPIWAIHLAQIACGDERENLLRIWELVSAGVFVVDGRTSTLEQASIRLSPDNAGLVERHLTDVSSG